MLKYIYLEIEYLLDKYLLADWMTDRIMKEKYSRISQCVCPEVIFLKCIL